ncbi:MAG: arsenate reductase family protein, partial [Sulfurimonas sp.]
MLLKRPVVEYTNGTLVGFNHANYEGEFL